ncbi:MAG: hypothetical protein LLF89_01240, partial [Spirochaetaceae bacterium]|nr:hypothetical protein [Spirochaetaceae bacterium]
SKMYSKSHITPFAGMRFAGRIAGTFVRGRCVFGTSRLAAHGLPAGRRDMRLAEDGWMTDTPGYGKFIQWGYA